MDNISEMMQTIRANPADFLETNRTLLYRLRDEQTFDSEHPAFRALQAARSLARLIDLEPDTRLQIEALAETADELLEYQLRASVH